MPLTQPVAPHHPPPVSAPQASDVFSEEVLERLVVQKRIGAQPLQLVLLLLQRLEKSCIRHLQTAVTRFPLVQRRARDPVRRQTSSVRPPVSCSRSTAMIFSLLKRLPFMARLLSGDGLYLISAEFSDLGSLEQAQRAWVDAHGYCSISRPASFSPRLSTFSCLAAGSRRFSPNRRWLGMRDRSAFGKFVNLPWN